MLSQLILLSFAMVKLISTSGSLWSEYSSDPNVRMQQLLNAPDIRHIQGEKRRFNDPPSHLTPERLHGGIVE